jgi:2-dehydro-3-deoxyphosphogluconate aldolase/(4S)-4-hydroxy-2-oxoglutarate aldolase
MRSRLQLVEAIKVSGLIAVIRVPKAEMVGPICEALLAGGISTLELTLTIPNALEAIREASKQLGPRALIGAGTVLDAETCRAAIAAGAEFVVSPVTKLEILKASHVLEKPAMIGAYTPTEAQLAHEAGADFIKIFPADKLGPGYIKNLRAPLPHLQIVPTGGVDLKTAPEFLKAGCAALGVGSSLLKSEILDAGNWGELTRLAAEYVRVVRETRGS